MMQAVSGEQTRKWPVEGYFRCAGGLLHVEINRLGRMFQTRTSSHSLSIVLPHHTVLPHRDAKNSNAPCLGQHGSLSGPTFRLICKHGLGTSTSGGVR